MKDLTYTGIPQGKRLEVELNFPHQEIEFGTETLFSVMPKTHKIVLDPNFSYFNQEENHWGFDLEKHENLYENIFFLAFYLKAETIKPGDKFQLPNVSYYPRGISGGRCIPISLDVEILSTCLID